MIATVTREGLAAARRTPRLAVTLWLLNLALALAAGVPGWLALNSAIGVLPEADALRNGLDVGVLIDLVELRPGLLGGLAFSALGVAFLGLLLGAAATGGALEVLTSADERPFAHRFGRGAGRFFGRFVRAGLLVGVVAVVVAGLVAGPLLALSGRLRRESGSELATNATWVGAVLLGGLVVLLALLALDAARVRIVREDARRVLPHLRSGFAVVLGHPAEVARDVGRQRAAGARGPRPLPRLPQRLPAGTGPLVLLMFVGQQAFVLVRSWLRVALLGSEIALVQRLRPWPPAPAPPQPAVEPLPEPLPEPAPF